MLFGLRTYLPGNIILRGEIITVRKFRDLPSGSFDKNITGATRRNHRGHKVAFIVLCALLGFPFAGVLLSDKPQEGLYR